MPTSGTLHPGPQPPPATLLVLCNVPLETEKQINNSWYHLGIKPKSGIGTKPKYGISMTT